MAYGSTFYIMVKKLLHADILRSCFIWFNFQIIKFKFIQSCILQNMEPRQGNKMHPAKEILSVWCLSLVVLFLLQCLSWFKIIQTLCETFQTLKWLECFSDGYFKQIYDPVKGWNVNSDFSRLSKHGFLLDQAPQRMCLLVCFKSTQRVYFV